MVNITINGLPFEVASNQYLIQVLHDVGVSVPCLCGKDGIQAPCGLCDVEIDGQGTVSASQIKPIDGMTIETHTTKLERHRKFRLQQLVSTPDLTCAQPPCQHACPAHVDIQSYLHHIAKNEYRQAVEVIKNTLPMPLSIGRVCPAFCEHACLRGRVDQPLAIRQLKRYAADADFMSDHTYHPEIKPSKGKRVAVIGAGPGGLSCGFFLNREGYQVDIFEAMPQAGGWLRYGIPEFRLPKTILDKEIAVLCQDGLTLHTNQRLGHEITLAELKAQYDAVCLAVGASRASDMKYKGSDQKGYYLGVDFLKDHMTERQMTLGKRVAIIGGGNTAIDCARTALRRGADVTLIYRRTRNEMPAEPYEIIEAEKEGVQFLFLTNPVENIADENGQLIEVVLEKMRLGEPDVSGRRRPQSTGEYKRLPFDNVIAAVSQEPDIDFLQSEDELPLSRWNTALVDENTMFTGVDNVFAIGDFRRGPATAIQAIADARRAAQGIDARLGGNMASLNTVSFQSRNVDRIPRLVRPDHAERLKVSLNSMVGGRTPEQKQANLKLAMQGIFRAELAELDVDYRIKNFEEVELGFSAEQAEYEAQRCMNCGSVDGDRSLLLKYAAEYHVSFR